MLRRCIAADPHHGESWTAVSKDWATLGNMEKTSTEKLVIRVAANMGLGVYVAEALSSALPPAKGK